MRHGYVVTTNPQRRIRPLTHPRSHGSQTTHDFRRPPPRQRRSVAICPSLIPSLHSPCLLFHPIPSQLTLKPIDTIIYAVSGHGSIVSDNGRTRQELGPGDFALIPAFAQHQEINDSDADVVWVITRGGRSPVVVNLDGWGQELRRKSDANSYHRRDSSEAGSSYGGSPVGSRRL